MSKEQNRTKKKPLNPNEALEAQIEAEDAEDAKIRTPRDITTGPGWASGVVAPREN